jgi:hypothetical protein
VAEAEFIRFLTVLSASPRMLARYEVLSMPAVLFHAQNEGFSFTRDDMDHVVGTLEAGVIVGKDAEPFDGSSSLWRQMWGQRYLRYLITSVLSRYTSAELRSLAGAGEARQAAS